MTSEPRVVDDPAADRFEVLLDDTVAGYVEYRRIGSSVAFTHTIVDPEFEGRGLGSTLARGALDATRAAGDTVLPFCPFMRGFIQRHPAYHDLVPADRHTEFELPAPADEPGGA